jgi:hypothetical protein
MSSAEADLNASDQLAMSEDINDLDRLFAACERQNGMLINEDGMQAYENEHGQVQHVDVEAKEDVAIAAEIAAVDLAKRLDSLSVEHVTNIRRSISEMVESKINATAQKTSTYCAQLATNHHEYLDMMEHMSAKVEPPIPFTPFDAFSEAEREDLLEKGADAKSLEGRVIRNWQARSLPPLQFPNIHLPVSIECDGADTSKSGSSIPGRAVWPMAQSVVDKDFWLAKANARNAAMGIGSTPGKLGRELQRARGKIRTTRWKHPSERARVEKGIKALKGLELARKFARSGAPKPPIAPLLQPAYSLLDGTVSATVANRYQGHAGRSNLATDMKILKAKCDQYPKEIIAYRERRSKHDKFVAAREQTLARNKAIALDSIKYLGTHHPDRGLWMRNMEPIRAKISAAFKPPSFADPVMPKSTLLSRREENAKAAASNVLHHKHMGEFYKAQSGLNLDAVAIGERRIERMRLAADRAAQDAFSADRSAFANCQPTADRIYEAEREEAMAVVVRAREEELKEEHAMQAKLAEQIAKQKEAEANARIPLWLKEEKHANEVGRRARAKKTKDVMERIHTRQAIKDLEEQERKAMKEAAQQTKGTLERFYAQTKCLIAKARAYTKSIKIRTVPAVKENGANSYFNIIMRSGMRSDISDEQMNGTFEDVDGDVNVSVRGSASKKQPKKQPKPRAKPRAKKLAA